jgi:hypothetical protein
MIHPFHLLKKVKRHRDGYDAVVNVPPTTAFPDPSLGSLNLAPHLNLSSLAP